MTSQQLTLLDYVTNQLSQLNATACQKLFPFDTPAVARRLGISPSTLGRAKRQGQLPYRLEFEGSAIAIDFAYHRKGKDYWTIRCEA